MKKWQVLLAALLGAIFFSRKTEAS